MPSHLRKPGRANRSGKHRGNFLTSRAQNQGCLRYLIRTVHATGTRSETLQGRYLKIGGTIMAATTDYDAPRRSTLEEAETESLEALTTARTDAQSPDVDLDEGDAGESVDLPGADLSGEELTMPVVPKQADEFTCSSCFLVQHRSRIASGSGASAVCIDCS